MKKVFIFLFSTILLISQLGCKSGTGENSNSANVNSNQQAQTNTNTNAQSQNAPLPAFTDANAALAEGKRLLDNDETEKSIEAFKQAVTLNPNLAEAHFNMGIAYALLEDEVEDTSTEEPTPTPSKSKKSKSKKEEELPLTQSQKSFAKAAEIYEKITDENPKDDASFYNLGRSYNKLNKDEEAEKAFKQAVKLKPEDPDYQTELGAILVKLSHYDEAIVALKKAMALDPNNSQIQDLLDKAEAGERRIKFGTTPTPPPTINKPKTNANQRPTPPMVIENAPIKPNANK